MALPRGFLGFVMARSRPDPLSWEPNLEVAKRWKRRLTLDDWGVRENPYRQILGQAVVEGLDEARFLLGALTKPAHRSDTTYVAGCLFRVVTLCAHAVHAKAGHWGDQRERHRRCR
jgi:hypothetical protein